MSANPFSITFRAIPLSPIERDEGAQEVIDAISPQGGTCIISGPREADKNRAFSKLKSDFKTKGWLTADLTPHKDMEEQLAAILYQEGKLQKLFPQKGILFLLSRLNLFFEGRQGNNRYRFLE
jgi:hypothetical protein